MNKKAAREREKRIKQQQTQGAQMELAKKHHELALVGLTAWAKENKTRCNLLIEEVKSKMQGTMLAQKDVVRMLAIDSWYGHEIKRGLKRCGKLHLAPELRGALSGELRSKLVTILTQGKNPKVVLLSLEKEFQRQREEIGKLVKST